MVVVVLEGDEDEKEEDEGDEDEWRGEGGFYFFV